MATRFDPLDLGDDRVFGVRLHGAFGRGDRQRLLELASRCVARQKTRLILECHDLDSLGGGGAAVLADLQRRLVAQGGEVVFVGAGEVVRRFLAGKFSELPLRCFEDVDTALAALRDGQAEPEAAEPEAAEPDVPEPDAPEAEAAALDASAGETSASPAPAAPSAAGSPAAGSSPDDAAAPDLDRLLDGVPVAEDASDGSTRRTADLVTAAYVSLDDALSAAGSGNSALLGETLGVLLDSHDLAARTILCSPHGDHYLAPDGRWRLPAQGGIVAALTRTGRPLTMLDLEDGDLWDEETELLEHLQPDIILPLVRDGVLAAVLLLQHGATGHDYSLSEMFALELLQRVLADAQSGGADAAAGDGAGQRPDPAADVRDLAGAAGSADAADAAASGVGDVPGPVARVAVPVASAGCETLLSVKLDLARGLQDAQDVPHFWQVFISRLRLGAEVTSLVFLDADPRGAPFLAGEARRGLEEADFTGERIRTFFRTLERPVEVENMPTSFETERDTLLARGARWLVGLRADGREHLGVVALGLRWRCAVDEPADQIHDLMEITAEALLRLRRIQGRSDLTVGLLENLLVGGDGEVEPADPVTARTVASVRLLASELGLPPDQERDLVLGALLRNIGQQRPAPDDLQADRLGGEQWEVFRSHPDAGERTLAAFHGPAAVRDAVRHHHERFDGRGFPSGLQGRDIPLVARLVAVAQTFALHGGVADTEAALEAVRQEAGTALDPDLVAIFIKAQRRALAQPLPS